ncbi:MAG TPA: GH25 family lysozyme [Bryobacteraceae bacterium]|nr:GH25 family lysozyme [Bryobacteraceae bacterium]
MPVPTQRPTVAGIDVSYYQETIDWPAVAASGIRYAFLKATEGAASVDRSFARNRANAAQAGLLRGAYHFFAPDCSAAAQASLFLRSVGKLDPGDLPPVLDLEAPDLWTNIAPSQRIRLVTEWLETVEKALLVTPIIYLSPAFAVEILQNDPALARHPVWLAHYTEAAAPRIPKPWASWTFWQHTHGGRTPGIPTPVDLNWFNGTLDQLHAFVVPSAPAAPAAS